MILIPATRHGPAEDEVLHELAEHGLRHYTAQVATTVGAGPEAAWSEWADAPSAYIALDRRLPDYPDRDVALTWAAEQGWAVAMETGCGEDLLIIASLDDDVLPPPQTVATWVCAVLTGTNARGRPNATAHANTAVRSDLANRLANWSGHNQSERRSSSAR